MIGTAGSALLHITLETSVLATRTAPLRKMSNAGNAIVMGTTFGSALVGSPLQTTLNGRHLIAWNVVEMITSRLSVPSYLFPASHVTTAPYMEGRGASGSCTWM